VDRDGARHRLPTAEDQASTLRAVRDGVVWRLAGGGEPLFHRKVVIDGQCDQITVSLNTADPESYSRMRNRIAERRRQTLKMNLQFLVWKEVDRTIPRTYALSTGASWRSRDPSNASRRDSTSRASSDGSDYDKRDIPFLRALNATPGSRCERRAHVACFA